MARKKLVIVYYSTLSNEEIVDADFNEFYTDLKQYERAFNQEGIYLQSLFPSSAKILVSQIYEILKEPYAEIYFHFNGHGEKNGIPYGKFLLEKEDFSNFLNNRKVKFCFFSSCNSETLSQLVFDKKVPIVIGIDGKIENKHAIAIQKKFYGYLANKKTFFDAFEKAVSEEKIQEIGPEEQKHYELGKLIHRGGGSLEDLKRNLDCNLSILASEEEKEKCLIYETFLDAITNMEDEREIVLVYCNRPNILTKFKDEFYKEGLDELKYELFVLDAKALQAWVKVKNEEDSLAYDLLESDLKIKIIFIFSVTPQEGIFSSNQNLQIIFDDQDFLKKTNYKYGVILKNGVDKTAPFKETDYFGDMAKLQYPYFYYQNDGRSEFGALFKEGAFNEFFTGISINPEERKEYIRNIACNPTKEESGVAEIAYVENNLFRIFFASKQNERLIHYIIKLMIHYREIKTPILISDSEYNPESASIQDWIKNAVSRLPLKNKFKKQFKVSEKPYVSIAEDLILVFRTNYQDITKLTEKINLFLKKVNTFQEEDELKKHLRLLFFINDSDGFTYKAPAHQNVASIINFSKPEPIDFYDWKKGLLKGKQRSEGKKIDKLLNYFSDEELKKYIADCPSSLIGKICDEFKIPQKHFLKIS